MTHGAVYVAAHLLFKYLNLITCNQVLGTTVDGLTHVVLGEQLLIYLNSVFRNTHFRGCFYYSYYFLIFGDYGLKTI